jgi:hypothetical protein
LGYGLLHRIPQQKGAVQSMEQLAENLTPVKQQPAPVISLSPQNVPKPAIVSSPTQPKTPETPEKSTFSTPPPQPSPARPRVTPEGGFFLLRLFFFFFLLLIFILLPSRRRP